MYVFEKKNAVKNWVPNKKKQNQVQIMGDTYKVKIHIKKNVNIVHTLRSVQKQQTNKKKKSNEKKRQRITAKKNVAKEKKSWNV